MAGEYNQRILNKKKFENSMTGKKAKPVKALAGVKAIKAAKAALKEAELNKDPKPRKERSYLKQQNYYQRRASLPVPRRRDLRCVYLETEEEVNRAGEYAQWVNLPHKEQLVAQPSATLGFKIQQEKLKVVPTEERFLNGTERINDRKAISLQNKLYYRFKVKFQQQHRAESIMVRNFFQETYEKL